MEVLTEKLPLNGIIQGSGLTKPNVKTQERKIGILTETELNTGNDQYIQKLPDIFFKTSNDFFSGPVEDFLMTGISLTLHSQLTDEQWKQVENKTSTVMDFVETDSKLREFYERISQSLVITIERLYQWSLISGSHTNEIFEEMIKDYPTPLKLESIPKSRNDATITIEKTEVRSSNHKSTEAEKRDLSKIIRSFTHTITPRNDEPFYAFFVAPENYSKFVDYARTIRKISQDFMNEHKIQPKLHTRGKPKLTFVLR